MADRDGILIWPEIPVNQYVSNMIRTNRVACACAALLEDNILTNQNHPSVMLWSIANELPSPATPAEARYIAGAAALASAWIPTRPVGIQFSNWPGLGCQSAYGPLQVIGRQRVLRLVRRRRRRQRRPRRARSVPRHRPRLLPDQGDLHQRVRIRRQPRRPGRGARDIPFQANSVAFHLGVFASKPWLSGAIYFLLQDAATWLGYSGGNPRPNPPFDQKGLSI